MESWQRGLTLRHTPVGGPAFFPAAAAAAAEARQPLNVSFPGAAATTRTREEVISQAEIYVTLLTLANALSLLLAVLILVECLLSREELLLSRYVWLGLLLGVGALHGALFALFLGSGSEEALGASPYGELFFHQYRILLVLLCGPYLLCLGVMGTVTFVTRGDDRRFKDYLQIQYIYVMAALPAILLCTYFILSRHFRLRFSQRK